MTNVWILAALTLTCFSKLSMCAMTSSDNINKMAQSIVGTKISMRPGRHVCTAEKVISRPIPVTETYKKPVYNPRVRSNCLNPINCPQFDVTYKLANRTVFHLQKSTTFEHSCCPGWTKGEKREKGCLAPICGSGCGDFGICVKPEVCQCQQGYSGDMCDRDIDECQIPNHGCQQKCQNTAGSYVCACQDGFNLGVDGKSCSYCFTCQEEYVDMMSKLDMVQKQMMTNNQVESFETTNRLGRLEVMLAEMTTEKTTMLTENTALQKRLGTLEVKIADNTKEKSEMLSSHQTMMNRIEQLETELRNVTTEKTELFANHNLLVGKIDHLQLKLENVTKEKIEMADRMRALAEEVGDAANLKQIEMVDTVRKLELHLSNVTEEKEILITTVSQILTAYDDVMTEVENLQNVTKSCKELCIPPPKASQTTAETSTTSTMQSITEPKTEDPFSFDTTNLIYSLSNQIGLLEEKLDLCRCHEQPPYR